MKDDSVYLLNDAKDIFQYRPLEMFVEDDHRMNENIEKMDKHKCEQSVSECKKLRNFIKIAFEREIKILSKTEYDHVQT